MAGKTTTIIAILFPLALASCIDDGHNNHGYGYEYDYEGVFGLQYRCDSGARCIEFDKIESAWLDTIDCTGITPSFGPMVILVPHELNDADFAIQGRIYYDTSLVLVMSLDQFPEEWTILVLKHEFVHFLLWFDGFDSDKNTRHDSALFHDCSY